MTRKLKSAKKEDKRPASHRHEHTDEAPCGLGRLQADAKGRLAHDDTLYSFCPAARWAPQACNRGSGGASSSAAVELEMLRASALSRLRKLLNSLCIKAGLPRAPLMAFERWRFACKLREETDRWDGSAAGSGTKMRKGGSKMAVVDLVLPHHFAHTSSNSSSNASGVGCQIGAEEGLVNDLVQAGMDCVAAKAAAAELASFSTAAAAALCRRAHQLASGKSSSVLSAAASSGDTVHAAARGAVSGAGASAGAAAVTVQFHQHSIDLSAGGHFVKVNRGSYGKLVELFRQHGPALEAPPPVSAPQPNAQSASRCHEGLRVEAEEESEEEEQQQEEEEEEEDGKVDAEAEAAEAEGGAAPSRIAFHNRLFALLLRYKSIQGHGFQAAAGPPVFEFLKQQLGIGMECFASPMNAHFDRFASAFADVDGPFGSSGSFFSLKLKHGSYEVNPPFIPIIMEAAVSHMADLLDGAEAAGTALSFAVILPGWQETPAWQMLKGSRYLKKSMVVAAQDHGFCDGASHQRRDPYRQSPYDSGVFVLQSSKGAAKWRVSDAFEKELQLSMALCVPSSAAVARHRKQRGASDVAHWGGAVTGGDAATQVAAASCAAAAQQSAAGARAAGRQDKNRKRKHRNVQEARMKSG